MRSVLAVLLLFLSWPLHGIEFPPTTIEQCAEHLPWGVPTVTTPGAGKLDMVCHDTYATAVDEIAKVPRWVSYRLIAEHALGCLDRSGSFMADPAIPVGAQASHAGYRGAHYDIGHMMPAADGEWDATAERATFLFSNAAPQEPGLNRGLWLQGEKAVRSWAWSMGDVVVVVGTVVSPADKKLRDGTDIPSGFYKVIFADGQAHGYLVSNTTQPGHSWADFRRPLAEIEDAAGITFPRPLEMRDDTSEWPSPIGAWEAARGASCVP